MPLAKIEKSFAYNLLFCDESEDDFLSMLSAVGKLTAAKQLNIYRSHVNAAHQKVLGQIYPACFNILGEDYFNQLCRLYRCEYPSTQPDLNKYGEYFSIFINKQYKHHIELQDFEYLADLALLEWHWHATYFSLDDELFAFEQLALINAEDHDRLVFKLSYSFFMFSSIYPVLDIWQANRNNIEENQTFEMPETDIYFCISRHNFMPMIEHLSSYQYKLLNMIKDGKSLTQLSEIDEESENFTSELMVFIKKSWVTGFYLHD